MTQSEISATFGEVISRIPAPVHCGIVPPHILEHLVAHAEDLAVREAAERSLALDALHREQRVLPPPAARALLPERSLTTPQRTVSDDHHTERLPGRTVRTEGAPPVADRTVDRAYDGLGATFDFYLAAYRRHSIDDRGLPLDATVHYGQKYDNAFWNGSRMIFGDGDGVLFNDFTVSVDVIGHELTHGVTQFSANLDYQGQSGALNESVSDVFGSLVKQYALGQTADRADWLIGAGLLAPQVQGIALRSMRAPGTAYDDPSLGTDPQPATMAGYVDSSGDNGGVHLNSGIPNHAFYLAATAIGGYAWERAGQIWYDVLTGGGIAASADFAEFAAATVAAAETRYGAGAEARAVREAWVQVGVITQN
ncbi:M4 family metallopeptidase [Streptacidiphilus sp. N1-12]|uniref:Neutral metalloproteinase n=2 Tax=Streptacidiphilus alkalitolerans TaxID=3342712 RepID=A0ABV6WKN1_9ACTN